MNDSVGATQIEEEALQDDDDDDDDDETQEGSSSGSESYNDDEDEEIEDDEEDDEEDEDDEDEDDEEEEDEWSDHYDQEEEDDDDDDDEEEEQEKTNETLWRDSFIQTCLRIARNDESLVQLNRPMDWYYNSSMAAADDAACQAHNKKTMLDIFMNSHDYWTDADIMLLGHALSHNNYLQSLTLETSIRMFGEQDDLSHTSFRALQRGLSLSHLQELTFISLCPEFQELLLQGAFMPHLGQQQQQQQHDQQQDQRQHSTAPVSKIQQLNLLDTSIDMAAFAHILTCHCNLLTHLSLTSCTIDNDDMEQLSSCLRSAGALSSLDLSHNDITDAGVRHFCEWCWNLPEANDESDHDADKHDDEEENDEHGDDENDDGLDAKHDDDSSKDDKDNNNNNSHVYFKLQVLNMGYNDIGLDGLRMLLRSIQLQEHDYKNRELHTLVLSGNENIGYQGLADVGRMYLSHHNENSGIHLQHLSMAKCATMSPTSLKITNVTTCSSIYDMMVALREGVWDAFALGLRHNTTLVSLDLGDNCLFANGVQAFMEAVAVHPTLQRLSLESNSCIGVDGLVQVGKMLPFVGLHELDLDNTCLEPFQKPDCDVVGQALLDGVRHNISLTSFSMKQLDECWMEPIQFHVDFNKTCRPLFCNVNRRNDSIATATTDDNNNHNNSFPPFSIWPHALARLHRQNKVSHVYFLLLEQPWVIPTKSTYWNQQGNWQKETKDTRQSTRWWHGAESWFGASAPCDKPAIMLLLRDTTQCVYTRADVIFFVLVTVIAGLVYVWAHGGSLDASALF